VVDLVGLDSAVFDRLASDAAGTDLRAALGDGAVSILMAEDLKLFEGMKPLNKQQLPEPPFLALRAGPAPITDRIAWLPNYTWYCYGDLATGSGAIRPLAKLIADAYEGFNPSGLGVGSFEVGVQAPSVDRVLGMWVMPVTLDLSSI
jgi:hypothetical protein